MIAADENREFWAANAPLTHWARRTDGVTIGDAIFE